MKNIAFKKEIIALKSYSKQDDIASHIMKKILVENCQIKIVIVKIFFYIIHSTLKTCSGNESA